jgi:hypothetical protein
MLKIKPRAPICYACTPPLSYTPAPWKNLRGSRQEAERPLETIIIIRKIVTEA